MSACVLHISKEEACKVYMITAETDYILSSSKAILKSEVQKIHRILAACREMEIVDEQRSTREMKFKNYVEWRPREEWGSIGEYTFYKDWQERMVNAETNLAQIKKEFQIISIIPSDKYS